MRGLTLGRPQPRKLPGRTRRHRLSRSLRIRMRGRTRKLTRKPGPAASRCPKALGLARPPSRPRPPPNRPQPPPPQPPPRRPPPAEPAPQRADFEMAAAPPMPEPEPKRRRPALLKWGIGALIVSVVAFGLGI